jgi:hypothetical protein
MLTRPKAYKIIETYIDDYETDFCWFTMLEELDRKYNKNYCIQAGMKFVTTYDVFIAIGFNPQDVDGFSIIPVEKHDALLIMDNMIFFYMDWDYINNEFGNITKLELYEALIKEPMPEMRND